MRVSLDWIKDFAAVDAPAQEIAHRLTMAGLEIEGMESAGSDVLMEVNVTPNRPDCLSIIGIAREVSALYGVPLKIPAHALRSERPSDVTVRIADPALCGRYAGRSVFGVKVGDSPEWMRQRLEKCGIRSINNIVDVTNYVMLEYGQPLHAFDADLLGGRAIRVAAAGERLRMRTLDGGEREIPAETLLIWDDREPVAIAGIMGGEGSSVSERTANVFLESAHFNPASIRKSSKILGLRSESSYRFERGTDIEFLRAALDRAAGLLQDIAGGTVGEAVDAYPVPYAAREITVPYRTVNALLGTDVAPGQMREILERISIRTEDRGATLAAFPPAFRGDLTSGVDLIEEVARCYGYDRIPARRPRTEISDGILNSRERLLRNVKEAMRRAGFSEVINFSFMNSAELDLLSIGDSAQDDRRRHIMLLNPLRREECLMRTTLVPALLRNFVYNVSRGVRNLRIFECSRVFVAKGGQLPSEQLRLGGVLSIDPSPAIWKETAPPFYVAKGALESLFDELRLPQRAWRETKEPFLHPGKSADILADGVKLGYVGELGPETVERLGLKMNRPQVIVFEIDMDAVLAAAVSRIVYRPLPKFPAIERDVALVIDERITAEQVLGVIAEYRSDLVERFSIFDHFQGKSLPQGMKSIGVRLVYRRPDRTLTDEEVEPVHTAIVRHALEKTGGTVRGVS
ncbi:MAG: phenylalanine--tRNA ligase subunit beta [Thermodesulfovibrionales bacterium]